MAPPLPPVFCACGCGQRVTARHRWYIHGHVQPNGDAARFGRIGGTFHAREVTATHENESEYSDAMRDGFAILGQDGDDA